MSRGTHAPKNRTPSFFCTTCETRVLEKNRVLHNVVCQRKAAKARQNAVRRKPDTSYAHSIYEEYAQSQSVYTAKNHRTLCELEYGKGNDGVYRNVAYIEKLMNERAAEQTSPPSPTAPSSPALSLAPFPLSPMMPDAVAYDVPRQVLPASRYESDARAYDMPRRILPASHSRESDAQAHDVPRQILSARHDRESNARYSEVFRDCQYCGREYPRELHMTHELQCAFTPIQCARCGQYVRRVDEQYHLQSGCLQGVMNASTRGISTVSRALTNHGRQTYTTDLRRMAGAAAFALAAYVGSRLASRSSNRGGGGPHIRYETVDGRGATSGR